MDKKRKYSRKAHLLAPFIKRYREKHLYQKIAQPLQYVLELTLQTDDGKLVFVKNAKAGCTTVAQMLYHYSKGKYCDDGIHHQTNNIVQGKEHWKKNLSALTDKDVVKFTLVRHPRDRTMSAFKNFFLERNHPDAPPHIEATRYFGFSENADIAENFDAYLNYLEACFEKDIYRTDQHFRLQTLNIGWGHVDYDIIGRLENIDADLLRVFKMAGAEIYIKKFNVAPRINRTNDEKIGLTSIQTRRIETLYAPDYEAFNYE